MRSALPLFLLILIAPASAQQAPESAASFEQRILDRLDRLERQNRELMQEVKMLREEVAAERPPAPAESTGASQSTPPLDERVTVNETRIADQAQTKIEAAHKYPIQLTGIVLFNAFSNTQSQNSSDLGEYDLLANSSKAGATMRQTLLGFNFQGPELPGSGRVNGSLVMDFWGGGSVPGSNWIRLRRADVSLDWTNRSFSVGQDKPLISPYEPDSLAEVGIPPLSGAGNLWYWLPQVRYEERFHLRSSSGVNAQIALLQTGGTAYQPSSAAYDYVQPLKPALEARVAFWHRFDERRRFEIAPGFHVSSIQRGGESVGSRIGSIDWLFTPSSHLSFTGTAFTGQNVAPLGSLGNGVSIDRAGTAKPVRSSGGWAQIALPLSARLTFNVFSGLENDERTGLYSSEPVHNWSYAGNVMYHLNSGMIVALEAMQIRLRSAAGDTGVQNRYDLAFGYLF